MYMYYIVNEDGNRYGPASAETIQQWYREGRVADSARFIDAATEEPVSRELLLPPVAPTVPVNGPPGQYGSSGQYSGYTPSDSPQRQAYRDVPTNYGYPPQPQLYGSNNAYTPSTANHSPFVAGLLAFFCYLAGYIYNKQALKGVTFLAIGVALSFVLGYAAMIWSIICMVDCIMVAKRIQRGETVSDWQTF